MLIEQKKQRYTPVSEKKFVRARGIAFSSVNYYGLRLEALLNIWNHIWI